MNIYTDKFNFEYKPNQRFLEEELLMYDMYRRKMESIMNKNNLLIKNRSFYILYAYEFNKHKSKLWKRYS